MTYVDGYVIPVPKKKVKAYIKMAQWGKRMWMKHGALEYYECAGDNLKSFPQCSDFKKLAKLKPSFDKTNGTITAGSASPLTDGAAGVFIASEAGLKRLPSGTPAVELVDSEVCAVDSRVHGLLMAPAFGVPRLLARNGLTYEDVALYEIHEAFASQVLVHMAAWESAEFLSQALQRLLDEASGHVLLDLARINSIDSTGIGELVGYLGRFQERNRRLVLVAPPERIRKLLEMAQLADLFPTYDDLDSALAAECR